MEQTQQIKAIKETATGILPGCRVLLFGSRARGDYNEHSDFDILVVVDEINPKEKRSYAAQIRKALVEKGILSDVLVFTEYDVRIKQHFLGHVLHYAIPEAKAI